MKIKIAVSIKMHLMIRVGVYTLLLHIYIEPDFCCKMQFIPSIASSNTYEKSNCSTEIGENEDTKN